MNSQLRPIVVFDLDDTLVDTSQVYWSARSSFIDVLQSEGLDPNLVLETFETFDEQNIRELGFSSHRYEVSMEQTYLHFVNERRISPNTKLEKAIGTCGRMITNQMPDLIEGAIDLLTWTKKDFKLCLLTRGTESLQMRKLEHHKLNGFFELVKVVQKKGGGEFSEIIDVMRGNPPESWVIGDSVKSDINPGIEAGARCILYVYSHHSYYWRQEYGVEALGPFYKIDRLVEAIDVLRAPERQELVTEISQRFA